VIGKGCVFSQLTFLSKLAIMATTAQAKGSTSKKEKKAYSKETYMFWFESMLTDAEI
jgi:hypothetical protein